MIVFKTIDIEGFGVFKKPYTFVLDRPGVNILALPNGSGKSTIWGALVWALYGKPLKAKSTVPTYPHLRPEGWKGTKVTVVFKKDESSYTITRCMDYTGKVQGEKGRNKVFITIGNEKYEDFKDKRSIDNFIAQTLGYSFELFKNSVVFPQKSKRFIEERGVDKRRIFEEVFNLEWITNTLNLAKTYKGETQLVVSDLQGKVNKVEAEVKSLEEFLSRVNQAKDEFEEEKKRNIKEITDEIKNLEKSVTNYKPTNSVSQSQIDDLEKEIEGLQEGFKQEEYDSLTQRVDRSFQLNTQAKDSISELTSKIKNLTGVEDPKCPTCNQVLNEKRTTTLTDAYELELSDLKARNKENNKLFSKLNSELNALKKVSKLIRDKTNILKELRAEKQKEDQLISSQQEVWSRIDNLRKDLKREEKSEFKDISGDMRSKVSVKKKDLDSHNKGLRRKRRMLDIYNWITSKPLSENGIKSFLINSMVSLLNQKLSEYTPYVIFEVRLEVDMESYRKDIYTIVTRDGYPVLLEDLSGGESQLVNVVVAFGLYDLIRDLSSSNFTNLQVYDELFESLDPVNVEVITDLIQARLEKATSIFIVTHKKNFSLRNANSVRI